MRGCQLNLEQLWLAEACGDVRKGGNSSQLTIHESGWQFMRAGTQHIGCCSDASMTDSKYSRCLISKGLMLSNLVYQTVLHIMLAYRSSTPQCGLGES